MTTEASGPAPTALCDCGSDDDQHALTCPRHDDCGWCESMAYDQSYCDDCKEGRLPDGTPHHECGGHGFWGYSW